MKINAAHSMKQFYISLNIKSWSGNNYQEFCAQNFIEQQILLTNFLLSRNEQDTSH